MGKYGGYMGRILRVDLSSGSIEVEELDWEIAAKYVGGRGYAAKLLYDGLPKGVDPLSPENILVFATGPVTGLPAPTSGRFSISAKSPLTGTIMDSNCGGYIGVELKRAGFDVIIVEGASPSPVYLLIRNEGAELKPAEHLWGKLVDEVQGMIRREVGDDRVKVASIGPAGENRVRIASIMADIHRAAGRGGLGAVMGSKGLKAIAAIGDKRIEPANERAFLKEVKMVNEVLSRNPLTGDTLGRYGTASLVHIINRAGILPTKNFQLGTFEDAEAVSGEAIAKSILVKKKGCFACPIMCGRVTKIKGPSGEIMSEGPEYETVWSLGPNCGISDIGRIAMINHLCNLYGLDTISFGNTVGFLMEAREKGLLEVEKPDLRWGNHEAVEEMVRLTAERRGVGELASEGVRRISERIGGKEFAMHVKGMELPAYDPRGAKGQGLAYATSNRGGCHLRAYMIESEILSLPRYLDPLKGEGKAGLVKRMQDVFAVLDSM
ncbi:MAG: aldehyde ferredoxin oxidoreductase family protein, partial [Candidatus Bathyarchaeia archaeon]